MLIIQYYNYRFLLYYLDFFIYEYYYFIRYAIYLYYTSNSTAASNNKHNCHQIYVIILFFLSFTFLFLSHHDARMINLRKEGPFVYSLINYFSSWLTFANAKKSGCFDVENIYIDILSHRKQNILTLSAITICVSLIFIYLYIYIIILKIKIILIIHIRQDSLLDQIEP